MGGSSRVSVVIPWRPGCPHREAALAWTLDRWRAAGYEQVLGEHDDGPWCKAAAVWSGLTRADGELLVIADADVWTDGVDAALDAVAAGAPWAVPHRLVHRLTPHATARVLAGVPPDRLPTEQPPYKGFEGGGITVLTRDLYDQVPLDPRYAGWGQEDESWALGLRVLAGAPWRGTAPLYHLWHPPQPRLSRRWGTRDGMALHRRYRAAAQSPHRMRALLDEIGGTDAVA